MRTNTLSIIVVALLISGCARLHDGNTNLGKSVAEINQLPIGQAREHIANHTLMTYDPSTTLCTPTGFGKYSFVTCTPMPGHGTQIEFFASDGRAFLWYPGNKRAVPSLWRLSRTDERYKICFRYPSRSYNPLTRQHGGRWDCRDLAPYASKVSEVRRGDIFGLSNRRLPFVLNKQQTTFDSLLSKMKTAGSG